MAERRVFSVLSYIIRFSNYHLVVKISNLLSFVLDQVGTAVALLWTRLYKKLAWNFLEIWSAHNSIVYNIVLEISRLVNHLKDRRLVLVQFTANDRLVVDTVLMLSK